MHGVIDSVLADPEAEDRFQAWKKAWKKASTRGTEAATAKRRARSKQPDHEREREHHDDFAPVVTDASATVH